MHLKIGWDNQMNGDEISAGDLVGLYGFSEDIYGIVISKKDVGAKNIIGRAGLVEVVDILIEDGVIWQVPAYQVETICNSNVHAKD